VDDFAERRRALQFLADQCRVTDENVKTAMLAANAFEERPRRVVVAMVDAHRHAFSAGRGDRRGSVVDRAAPRRLAGSLRPAGHVHGVPVRAECDSDATAGAPAGAGDHGHACVRPVVSHPA
jgi:hypothetical protein